MFARAIAPLLVAVTLLLAGPFACTEPTAPNNANPAIRSDSDIPKPKQTPSEVKSDPKALTSPDKTQ